MSGYIKYLENNGKNMSVCYYRATYELQSESTLYSLPECEGALYLK